jgi:hypothetical protein
MPNVTSTITGGGGVDTRDFRKFAKALMVAAPMVYATLRINMRGVGDIVANEARGIAAGASTTVPDSIKVRVSGATVSVVAGGAGVPMGGLLEEGNVGGSKGTFRHPVFGNATVWASQPMHPFLAPALANKMDAAEIAAVEALDLAIEEAVTG